MANDLAQAPIARWAIQSPRGAETEERVIPSFPRKDQTVLNPLDAAFKLIRLRWTESSRFFERFTFQLIVARFDR